MVWFGRIKGLLPGVLAVLLAGPLVAQSPNWCVKCHAQEQSERLARPVTLWNEGVHKSNGIFCQDCHGGNARAQEAVAAHSGDFLGGLTFEQIPLSCGKCHTIMYENWAGSPHYKQFQQIGEPQCVDCHSSHKVAAASIAAISVPKKCAFCHKMDQEIAAFKTVMLDIKRRLDEIPSIVERFHKSGIKVSDIEGRLALVTETFLNKMSHHFDLITINEGAAEAGQQLKSINQIISEKQAELTFRKRLGGLVTLFCLGLAGLLLLYHRYLPERFEDDFVDEEEKD